MVTFFQSETCLGSLDTLVLLSFQRSIFCKWPIINVILLTLKNISTQNTRLIIYFIIPVKHGFLLPQDMSLIGNCNQAFLPVVGEHGSILICNL